MSDLEPVPDGVDLGRGESDLDRATAQLRAVPPPPVEVADRVLARALAAPRRSQLVRARPPYAYLRVSTLTITALLRRALDAGLTGAAVGRVRLDVSREEQLTGLTIELIVQYGASVPALADRARGLARVTLTEILGPGDDPVVRLSHVHVGDVTVGDPHLVDPGDEQ